MYIILIDFESSQYNESGTLEFKTNAIDYDEAYNKANIKIQNLNREDKSYNHKLNRIIDINNIKEL